MNSLSSIDSVNKIVRGVQEALRRMKDEGRVSGGRDWVTVKFRIGNGLSEVEFTTEVFVGANARDQA